MAKKIYVREKKKNRALKAVSITLAVLVIIASVLRIGVLTVHREKIWRPSYKKQDISSVINKDSLSESDYLLVSQQTGLSKKAIDELISLNLKKDILQIQNDFFEPLEEIADEFAPYTCCHLVPKNIKTVPLKEGDIIVAPKTHFSFFMLGHSAIVVDPEGSTTASAVGYASESYLEDVLESTNRVCFVVLRPKNSELAKKAAQYAKGNLLGLPYSISIGLTSPKFKEKTDLTHCSHLVWRAFKEYGVDIDSNGGMFVYPADFLYSEQLEIIQVYGCDPSEFLK